MRDVLEQNSADEQRTFLAMKGTMLIFSLLTIWEMMLWTEQAAQASAFSDSSQILHRSCVFF